MYTIISGNKERLGLREQNFNLVEYTYTINSYKRYKLTNMSLNFIIFFRIIF